MRTDLWLTGICKSTMALNFFYVYLGVSLHVKSGKIYEQYRDGLSFSVWFGLHKAANKTYT